MSANIRMPWSTRTMNLAHYVEQQARRLPDRPAFVWGETIWDWRSFDDRVKRMAGVLTNKAGGAQGATGVMIQSQNCNQLFESFYACLRLGGESGCLPIFRCSPGDFTWMAELSGAKVMLWQCCPIQSMRRLRRPKSKPDCRLARLILARI